MGVIKHVKNFQDPLSNVEDDPLSDMIDSADDSRFALELAAQAESERRRRRVRRSNNNSNQTTAILRQPHDVEGLSSRLANHKSQRKQRRIQNDKQLRAMWCSAEEELGELSIYDFVDDSVSVFALMLEQKDNLALWNAIMAAEPDDIDSAHYNKRNSSRKDRRSDDPAFTAEECYSRLDSDMKRTLKRQRCPTELLRKIEEDLEDFFKAATPNDVFKTRMDTSYTRLLLHAACEYMNLRSRSIDHKGIRWTLVKNPNETFHCPTVPLSKYLDSKRKTKTKRI